MNDLIDEILYGTINALLERLRLALDRSSNLVYP